MFERELTLYKFNLNYLRLLAADVAESNLGAVPFEGANPPVWILGHLAMATDFAARLLGLEPACPREWHKQFAPGSKPSELKPPWPTKSELLAAIENGHRRVSEAAPGASADAMNKLHNVELLKPTNLTTNGDVLAHLMTTHIAFHLAQLSACRRKAGKGPIV
ncbi:MAG: DinB family protein [Pirellulales bacterium]